jgi:hypothetical protein
MSVVLQEDCVAACRDTVRRFHLLLPSRHPMSGKTTPVNGINQHRLARAIEGPSRHTHVIALTLQTADVTPA